MAKHVTPREEIPSYVVAALTEPPVERKSPIAAIVLTIILVAYVAACYLLLGPRQPVLIQRLLGGGCAALALATFLLYARREEVSEEMRLRQRMAQEFDFGKDLLVKQEKQPQTVKIPLLGEIRLKFLGGLAVFVLTAAWWATPVAPVRVKLPVVIDLTVPFGEQIATAILVVPDGHTPMVRPPLLPPGATMYPLRSDANQFERGLKAMTEGQFAVARTAFVSAQSDKRVNPTQLNLARAQNEMFAGMFVDAAAIYAQVLREREDDPLVLMQTAVAWLYARTPGALATAELRAAQAWRACADLPANDRLRGLALNLQAVVLILRGSRLEQAENLCTQTRLGLPNGSQNVALLAASFSNQAVLYLIESKYLATVNLFEEARYRWGQAFGRQGLLVAACLGNQAALQIGLANFAKADDLLATMKTIQSAQLPAGHPLTAYRMLSSATLEQSQGHYAEAQSIAEDALALLAKNYGDAYIGSLPLLSLLASVHYQLGHYEKSEAYNQESLRLNRLIFGDQHPAVAEGLCCQAKLLVKQKSYAEAETACNQAAAIYQEAYGPECAGVADALSIAGRLELARERPRAARPLLEKALKYRQDLFGKRHPAVAAALGNLALLDNTPATLHAGEARFTQAIEMERSFFADDHPEVACLLRGRAELLAADSKYTEAANDLQQALAIQDKFLPESHPAVLKVLVAYAAVLRKEDPPDTQHASQLEERIKKLRASLPATGQQ